MLATTSFLKSLSVEICASGHRSWPEEAKALAVSMTFEVGATVNAVAERFGILPNQLSAWRREAKQCKRVLPAARVAEPVFAPLVVCHVTEEGSHREVTSQTTPIRIIRGAVVIELAHDIPATRMAQIVHALEARPCCCPRRA
ncbi:transposase [Thioclava sp. 'Guangxiensis']|uniref:transposase n=1 Tax=unclassified Thioclava TaxID=2621713 RepID=UPI003877BF99